MEIIRKSSIAGSFYPKDPKELEGMIKKFLSEVKKDLPLPKAIIAPHAGYIYSGPIAASAYACLARAQGKIKRVVMFGPTHFYPIFGLAAPEADCFETPLGSVPIDREAIYDILNLPQVKIVAEAHQQEHSLEIQLPFLQVLLKDFKFVPLVAGNTGSAEVAEVMELLWGDDETLIVVSSDLSHYHSYSTAKKKDKATTDAILALDPDGFGFEDACGTLSIRGLLVTAAKKNMEVTLVDLRNSGDTTGVKDKVVGYSAFHFREKK